MTPSAPLPPPVSPGLPRPSLTRIVTVARAGGLAHARALFEAGGYAAARHDAAALAVAGRLAKDAALHAPAADRAPLLAEAAAAYGAAFALIPQAYTRINQATLTWLAGDRTTGQALARDLLATLDRGDHPAETAYWLAATRAEAHLLLGQSAAAESWLAQAVALGPDSLDDRAATLRQLRLILAASDEDAGWLDPYRPGAVVHFGGHLGVSEAATADLVERVALVLGEHRAVAGYGALAAGADLVIAEALLARGAELNVILPVPPAAFLAQSVLPYGPGWGGRFAAASEAASSLRWVTTLAHGYQPLATRLAADVAMGAARVQAGRIGADALQLLVTDDARAPFGKGRGTAYMGETWAGADRAGAAGRAAQVCLVEPRSAPVAPSGLRGGEGRTDLRLISLLQLSFAGLTELDDDDWAAETDRLLAPFHRAIAALGPAPALVMATAQGYLAGFFAPEQAWAFARAATALPEGAERLRITAHHGLAHWLPAAGGLPDRLTGCLVGQLADLGAAALPGVTLATEAFVAALGLRVPGVVTAEVVGECAGQPLFALEPRAGESVFEADGISC